MAIIVSDFKIQAMHSPSSQVSRFSTKPVFLSFNFIPRSRISPQFRASIPPINRLHCLSLSTSPSSSPVSVHENSSNEHSFEVSYLINTFGWPPELAISKAKNLKLKTTEKPDRVLAFLKRHRFTQTQISRLVQILPRLLNVQIEKTLLPRFGFLSSLGLSTTEVSSVVTKAPLLLTKSLENALIPNFNRLCNLVSSYDEAVMIVKRNPMILILYQELDTQILLKAGVPIANIVVFMRNDQRQRNPTPTPDSLRKMVEEVKEMGFDPCTMNFLYALRTKMVLNKSTWEDQVQVFKKYGWSDHEILLALKKLPWFIMCSKNKVEGVMDFLVNTMGIEATAVANYPKFFYMSLEKRIIPRCLVYLFLLEKGLYDKEFSRIILGIKEAEFLTRFIKRYENEAPELWDLYKSLMKLHRLSLSSPSPSPVSYLMRTFGWPPELAISKSKNLRFKTLEKPERMRASLKKHGFTETQISLLVKKEPKLLQIVNLEKALLPMFFLSSLGLSKTEITDIVTKAPQNLRRSLEKIIIPNFNLLHDLVNSNDEAVKMIKRYPRIVTHYHKADNIQILLNAGVPAANIVVFMSCLYANFAPPSPDNFRKMVEEVKEMGFDPCTMKFLSALRVIKLSSKSYWEDKVQVFKKCGWSDRDILLAFEKHPRFIYTSKDKIEGVMDVLVNKMGFEVADISDYPNVFNYSLEKTIIPRFLVYQFLLEKGLYTGKLKLLFLCHEKSRFVNRFIKPYEDEAPQLWDLYKGKFQVES